MDMSLFFQELSYLFSHRLYLWPAFSIIPQMSIAKYVKMFLSWSSGQSASRIAREQILMQSYVETCSAALHSIVPPACIEEIVSKGLSLSDFVSAPNDVIEQKFGSQYWVCNAPLGSVDSQGNPLLCAFNRNVVGNSVCETCRTEHTGWACGSCFASQNQVGTIRCKACKLPNIKAICGASATLLECEQMYVATVIRAPTMQDERKQLPADGVIEFALKTHSGMLLSVKVKSPSDDVAGAWTPDLQMLPSGTAATRRDVFRFLACANGKFRIQSVLNGLFFNYHKGSLKLHDKHATEFNVQPIGASSTPTICISASSDSFLSPAHGNISMSSVSGGCSNVSVHFELVEVAPPSLPVGQAPPKNSSCQFAHVVLASDAPQKQKETGPLRNVDEPEAKPRVGVISDCAKPDNWGRLRVNGFWDYDPKYLVVVDPRASLQVSLFQCFSCHIYISDVSPNFFR